MNRDVDFLYEVGSLRFMPRQWSRFLMPEVANNSEHMFRVVWIALVIAARQDKPVDTGKIVKMAIVHDLAETRTGDVDAMSRQYSERFEEKAEADMFDGTSVGADFLPLLEEYRERTSLESRIVKDADNLDCDMELAERAACGHTLAGEWRDVRDKVRATKLFTEAARQLYDEIWSTSPHHWHVASPQNRVNAGDWQPGSGLPIPALERKINRANKRSRTKATGGK